ncbi:hypothetical protein [Mycobacteroides immunogenum]|jgi:hypothetical protein|nr:hypothetical protein [Mycobacteroides immunogenum]
MSDYYKTGFEQDVLGILNDIRKTLNEALEIQKRQWERVLPGINITGRDIANVAGDDSANRQNYQGNPRR